MGQRAAVQSLTRVVVYIAFYKYGGVGIEYSGGKWAVVDGGESGGSTRVKMTVTGDGTRCKQDTHSQAEYSTVGSKEGEVTFECSRWKWVVVDGGKSEDCSQVKLTLTADCTTCNKTLTHKQSSLHDILSKGDMHLSGVD